ncbi:MAG: chromosome segregation protein SMC [Chloroflexi bacterium RBG_16_48_8]|nr:MAG: chromosome segregation protein SMC [Chloroflexi bacterium RBG_16_48_8]
MKQSVRTTPRLRSLELQGYKTFVNKNTFEFAPTITAFVGPNGSGKSNIADSIRWVLGEQAYTLLRGKKTEDMIFSGSETRSRASMASASITFDNKDGWLPIDFTEVTISRRAYRDGVNEYFLNGQKVRLKDVTELLAQCGLGQRTYTIIGQGLVDAALSLNPEERRRLFEEAAGIGLYRNRKSEALRRLEATRRNLERVQDIITELRPRLRSLERQAKLAQDYHQVREDLLAAMRVWYGYHWYQLQGSAIKARRQAEQCENERNELRQEQVDVERALNETRSRIDSHRTCLHQWSQEISDLFRAREQVGKSLAVSIERNRWLTDQEGTLNAEVIALGQAESALTTRILEIEQEMDRKRAEVNEIGGYLSQLEQVGEGDGVPKVAYWSSVNHLREEIEKTTTEYAAKSSKMDQLSDQVSRLSARQEDLLARIQTAEKEYARILEEQEGASSLQEQAQKEQALLENKLDVANNHLDSLRSNKDSLTSQRSKLENKEAALKAQLELITQRGEQPVAVVEAILDGLKQGRLTGLAGRLWDKLQVESEVEVAVSAALGDFKAALIFKSFEDVEKAVLELMEKKAHNKTSLVPIAVMEKPSRAIQLKDAGYLGNALEFVEAPEAYHPILNLLLGRTLVVKDRDAALRNLQNLSSDVRIVTLSGDIFYPTGMVVLGAYTEVLKELPSLRAIQGELSQVQTNLKKLHEAVKRLEKDENDSADRQAQLVEHLKQNQQELQRALLQVEKLGFEKRANERTLEAYRLEIHDLAIQKKDIEERLSSMRSEAADIDGMRFDLEQVLQRAIGEVQKSQPGLAKVQEGARLEMARQSLEDLEGRHKELKDQLDVIVRDLELRKDRIISTQMEMSFTSNQSAQVETELACLERLISDLESKIQPEERALTEAENAHISLETSENQTRASLRNAERTHSQAQIDLARLDEELSSLKRRIEDDFGLVTYEYDEEGIQEQDPLPLEGYVEHLPKVEQLLEGSERDVNRLRSQLRRIGVVNPEAMREYETVRSRVEFLTTQLEDAQQAEVQIQKVIAELDLLMEREFRKTFDAVAVEFREAFKRLFGGGAARLSLTDPDDLIGTGIDIEARLPGRREQGLAVLSGGERSLTASALIFALMKVSPTPFCVMDEVDAMLDDANVFRFREMLEELSGNTQFVLITHNRQTVQVAEVIYGVTMGADSASQVISLKLDEAEKAIEA